MKSEIHIIAEAILANTQVLKMLVEKLPDAVRAEVAAVVEVAAPAPVVTFTPAPAPVVMAAPAPVVEVAPAPAPVAVAPAPVAATTGKHASFTTQKELIAYVMDAYKAMGQVKGAQIQDVLNRVGIKNINEVNPSMYQALFDGIEALK